MTTAITIPAAQTALLVIDAQESFRQRPYWAESDVPSYLARQQALIDGCAARGVAIVQVFHHEETGVFSRASGFVKTLAPLSIKPDFVVDKIVHSALAGTPLKAWLTRRGIRRLLISGIRTEQCCETTTRAASDAGYLVDYITEATLTFPMTHPVSGQVYSADDIKARTELVLHQRFARIATVEQVLGEM
ncbi:isochorismatase family protein [Pandoraea sp.]|uniref:isochorismatase family protein n=1 Tax=Pandoraea sp. TaxID=1883445 RepID=UPI00121D7F18|nr:isochorismatase family protein [Pandoraea sp.]TAL54687.1 MAG: isochorismatase family protein [Pandoraea sp.]TAM18545.1 MAG: isochorismatase family protein [Pandoraea sp.]